jgi:hypothetical protein
MTQPNSIRQWQEREEQMERRQEAWARSKRQQFELFELGSECPNCGEAGYEPVYGVSHDASTGYSSEEQACVACVKGAM